MTSPSYRKAPIEKLKTHLGISNPPIQVLLGPRQVGKTTSILAYLKEYPGLTFYHTADQISPPDTVWIENQWVEAREKIPPGKRSLLVFDEVQKIVRWSEVVKKCFDEDKRKNIPLDIVLLGSSSLLVQRGLTESLAGRFEIIYFPHWSFQECREAFGISFDQYVFYGGYPGALNILVESGFDWQRWGEYVRNALIETVLNKDILLLTPVVKPALFRQVFQLSCAHAGEVLSLNKMMGQLQEAGNASTIASYLKLLEAAMLLKPLERFSGSPVRQKTSSPKLQILNNALINAALNRELEQTRQDRFKWGRLVENMVGASLLNNNMGKGLELYYWRDRDREVDFVLRFGERLLGLEVKSGLGEKAMGMKSFLKRVPFAKGLVVQPEGSGVTVEALINLSAEDLFGLLGF